MIKVGHAKIIQNEEKPNTKYGHCTSFSRWAYEHINEIHSLSFISNVYKQRFLVLVKNSKSVRNKLAKSAPISRKLRNKTSQKFKFLQLMIQHSVVSLWYNTLLYHWDTTPCCIIVIQCPFFLKKEMDFFPIQSRRLNLAPGLPDFFVKIGLF